MATSAAAKMTTQMSRADVKRWRCAHSKPFADRAWRAHRDVRDIDVLVLHLHEAEVLLGLHLAVRRELRDCAACAMLRLCHPAGSIVVGVDFDAWPPVLEYTSVSMTRILMFLPEAIMRSCH